MATNREIEVGARSIAKDRELPGGGSKKLSRIVHDHFQWFDAAEARGMTWSDMIRLLTANGVVGKNGKALSVGTLSSTVWRRRAELQSLGEKAPSRSVGKPRLTPSKRVTKLPRRESDVQTKTDGAFVDGGKRVRGALSRGKQPAGGKFASNQSKPPIQQATALTASSPNRPNGAESKKDVLAFMNRAASVRRKADEK